MLNDKKKRMLMQFPFFHHIEEDEYGKIESYFFIKKVKKNTFLFRQGEALEGIFFLVDGKVKIYKHNDQGKEQLVNLYISKDIFPHVGYYFHTKKYPAHALVLENAEFLYIPIDRMELLLKESPTICMLFLNIMGEKVIDLHNRLEDKLLATTTGQVANLLIRLSQKYGAPQDNQTVLLKEIFQNTDLASMIGMTRETVSRVMNTLYADNIIQKDAKGKLIIHIEKINRLI